jgi:hypothetical protein
VVVSRYLELHVVNDYLRFTSKGQDTEQHSESLINMAQSFFLQSDSLTAIINIVLVAQTTLLSAAASIPVTPKPGAADGGLDVLL